MKLNPEFPWKSSIQQEKGCFHQQIGLQYKEQTSKLLHLEHSLVWCWKLNTSESRSEVPGMFEIWCSRRMEIIWTERVGYEV